MEYNILPSTHTSLYSEEITNYIISLYPNLESPNYYFDVVLYIEILNSIRCTAELLIDQLLID